MLMATSNFPFSRDKYQDVRCQGSGYFAAMAIFNSVLMPGESVL